MSKIKLLITFSILLLLTPVFSKAATLYLMPPSQTIYTNDTFIVDIRLDTEGEEINSVEANLELTNNILNVIDFNKGGSILNIWVKEPIFDNRKISLLGGVPGGFSGDGIIAKITFQGKEIGKTEVKFKEDSKVLLNDGKGTLARLNFLEGSYEIVARPENLPVISSSTHPDQNNWYNQNTLHLHWDLIEGAEYSFILSKDPLVEPDNIPDRPEGELVWVGDMEYPGLENGIYYFHLKQKLADKDWSEKVTFRAMIDTTPPEAFKPEIGREATTFEGKYFLSFATIDKESGIDYYQVKEGKKDFKKAESPYLLEDQTLRDKVFVKAIDKAGNGKIVEIVPVAKPFPYWIVIIILVSIGFIIWLISKIRKKK